MNRAGAALRFFSSSQPEPDADGAAIPQPTIGLELRSPKPLTQSRQLPALTAVRGIAAWWIVLYHFREEFVPAGAPPSVANLFSHGYLAVDLFFELSGFILSYTYLACFDRITLANVKRFLGLRLARIYPLHVFMLLAFLLNPLAIRFFSSAGAIDERYNLPYFLLSTILMQNWGLTRQLAWNIPAWSISTEWFAYLLFPVLAFLAIRFLPSRLRAVPAGATLLMALAAGGWLAGGLGANIPAFGLPRCVLEFSLGVCMYRFWAMRRSGGTQDANFAALIGVGLLVSYAVLRIPDYSIIPLAFIFILYALASERSLLARLVSFRTFEVLGLISYSTYLVHYFVRDWVKFLLVRPDIPDIVALIAYVLVVLAGSLALYHSVELPGRRAFRELTGQGVTVRGPVARVGLR